MVVSTDPGCDGEQDLGAAPSGSTILNAIKSVNRRGYNVCQPSKIFYERR